MIGDDARPRRPSTSRWRRRRPGLNLPERPADLRQDRSERPQGDRDRQRHDHHRHRRRPARGADRSPRTAARSRPRSASGCAAGAAQPDRRDAADPGGEGQRDRRSRKAEIDQTYDARRRELQAHARRSSRTICASSGSSERSIKRQIEGELAWQRLLRPQGRAVRQRRRRGGARRSSTGSRRRKGTEEYHIDEIYPLGDARDAAAQVLRQRRARSSSRSSSGALVRAFARQFSEASTAAVGGDLGWVRAEQLPEPLAAGGADDAGRPDRRPDRGAGRLSILVPGRQAPGADRRSARRACSASSS